METEAYTLPVSVSRPVRVLYITPGGIEARGGMGGGIRVMARYLIAAYRTLAAPPDCRVINPYGPGPFALMPLYFAAAMVRLLAACALRRVDVVHLHMSTGGSTVRKLPLLRLAGLFGVPTILHIHGSRIELYFNALPAWRRRLLVSSIATASRVVVIGEFWRRYMVETLGCAPDKVIVVHNGVPLPPPPTPRTHVKPCVILALGELGPRKGTPELLHALASLRTLAPGWRAVVAGNGPVEQYRAEAAALGLADRLDLPGWVDAVRVQQLLKSSDVFVLPSHSEGLPVAILEAMAAGLPVVTTPVGAIPDLVVHGETGLMVAPGSVEELTDALVAMVTDPKRRATLGARGRRRIEANFTIDGAAARLNALYDELAATRR